MPTPREVLTPDALAMSSRWPHRQLCRLPRARWPGAQRADLPGAPDRGRARRAAVRPQFAPGALTEAGAELICAGQQLLQDIDAMANRVKRVATGWEPMLTIAVDSVIARDPMLDLAPPSIALEPPTRLKLRDETLLGTIEALTSGEADLAIGRCSTRRASLHRHGHSQPAARRAALRLRGGAAPSAGAPAAAAERCGDAPAPRGGRGRFGTQRTEHDRQPVGGQDVLTVPSMQAKLAAQLHGLGGGFPARADGAALHRGRPPGRVADRAPAATGHHAPAHGACRAAGKPGRALEWWLAQFEHEGHAPRAARTASRPLGRARSIEPMLRVSQAADADRCRVRPSIAFHPEERESVMTKRALQSQPTATELPPPHATSPSSAPASPAWPARARWCRPATRSRVRVRPDGARRPHGQRVDTAFGRFDSGAQYFTVRDRASRWRSRPRPACAGPGAPTSCACSTPHGRVAEAALPSLEAHWVAQPGMDALVAHWAKPLGDSLVTGVQVTQIEPDALDRQALATAHRRRRRRARVLGLRRRAAGHAAAAARAAAGRRQALALAQPQDRIGAHRALLDADDRLPAGQPAHHVAPGPAMERGAQHAPPRRLAGARIVQARPRSGRALDAAGQPAWSQEHLRDDEAARRSQAAARLRRDHRHPRHAGARQGVCCWRRSPDAGAARQAASVGRQGAHRPGRRLVHGPSRRRRLPFGPVAGPRLLHPGQV
jgi:hypothetical protein